MKYTLTLQLESNQDCSGFETVRGWLREFNHTENSLFMQRRELPENAAQQINLLAYIDGELIGGLLSETQFKWLKISIVAVSPSHRKKSVGKNLILTAERIAATRGCRYSFLDTMAYQAPDFYLKCGYAVSGELPDWDSHGHAKFFFTKAIG